MTMDRQWRLLSPRQCDCELVKMDEEWLFINRTVLRIGYMKAFCACAPIGVGYAQPEGAVLPLARLT